MDSNSILKEFEERAVQAEQLVEILQSRLDYLEKVIKQNKQVPQQNPSQAETNQTNKKKENTNPTKVTLRCKKCTNIFVLGEERCGFFIFWL